MTKKIFLDAYAWVEIFEESQKGKEILTIIRDYELHTPLLNYYEILLKYSREASDIAHLVAAEVKGISRITLPDEIIVENAVDIKLNNPQLSMADAIAMATAIHHDGLLVTGDKDFKDIKHSNIKYIK